MKKLLYAAAALLMAACQQLELPEPEEAQTEETRKFTFTIKGDFLSPEFTEGKRKANAYMTADGAEMTDLWVIDVKDGEVKQTLHQTSTDADWGAPSMPLTLGTHHIKFLASRGQQPTYADGVVTWTRMNDTFFCDYEVTVFKTSNGNRAVTLERVATRLTLIIEDAMPQGTTAILLTPTTWYNGWNMLTNAPVEAQSYVARYDLPANWAGAKGNTLNMWGLSTTDEWLTDISVTSLAGESENAATIIENAPMKANRVTKYSGNLYTNAEQSSVSLNAEWLQSYEGVY